MFHSEFEELTQANHLIREARYEDALQLLKDFEEKENIFPSDVLSCHLIKCNLLLHQSLYEEVVESAEQIYKESSELGNSLLSVDALLIMSNGLLASNNIEPAIKKIEQAEELIDSLKLKRKDDIIPRKSYLYFLKGILSDPLFSPVPDIDLALENYNNSMVLAESVNDNARVISNLNAVAWIIYLSVGNLNKALEYAEKALILSNKIKDKFYITRSLLIKALIYHNKGNVIQSIDLYEKSLTLAKEIKNNRLISSNLNNMADAYKRIGKFDNAIECSQRSIELFSESGDFKRVAMFRDTLIQILVEKGDIEQARHQFNHLKELSEKVNHSLTDILYLFNKAVLLKASPRISNRGKAEDILKQILSREDLVWELKERVLLTLCDLLLSELQLTGDLEVLEEVESYITQLLDTAQISHSYWMIGETYLLQAKLALISLNLNEARRLLTLGQKTAEKYGLELLAIKISNDHDELIKQISIWNQLKESGAPLVERLELSRLNNQMNSMIKKRALTIPKLLNDIPMLLLIVSEGGKPIFSKYFIEEPILENHLFAGFLSAIKSFISETFSAGLDRITFGDYTILVNSLSPFFICYVFKGRSYSAHQKIGIFSNKILSNEQIWTKFVNFYQMNKEIQLKDVPSLEPLIQEIFIKTTI